jgi:hypothetical protein
LGNYRIKAFQLRLVSKATEQKYDGKVFDKRKYMLVVQTQESMEI